MGAFNSIGSFIKEPSRFGATENLSYFIVALIYFIN